MAKVDEKAGLAPSLLDRLIDETASEEAEKKVRGQVRLSVAAVKKSVARDLEALLNTYRAYPELPEGCTEVARSPLAYGLPDTTRLNPESDRDRKGLRKLIKEAIETFEPRLTNVRVIEDESRAEMPYRQVKFRIEATLLVDPVPEAVIFDTDLRVGDQKYVVRG